VVEGVDYGDESALSESGDGVEVLSADASVSGDL